jgi:hypothetical protein
MPKENSTLHIKLSPKLKQQYEAICEETETNMSVKTRELIANLVRNHVRAGGKVPKTDAN